MTTVRRADGRIPSGMCGLKYCNDGSGYAKDICRIPSGMCGLKSNDLAALLTMPSSHPVWDVWIEICVLSPSHCARSSHPVWDVWIEIFIDGEISGLINVASRLGCVD